MWLYLRRRTIHGTASWQVFLFVSSLSYTSQSLTLEKPSGLSLPACVGLADQPIFTSLVVVLKHSITAVCHGVMLLHWTASNFSWANKFQQLQPFLQISLAIVAVKILSNHIPIDLSVSTAWPDMVLMEGKTLHILELSLCAPVHNVDLKKQNQEIFTSHHSVSLQQTWNTGAYKLFIQPWRLVHWVITGNKLLRPNRQWFLICLMEHPSTYSGKWEQLPFLAWRHFMLIPCTALLLKMVFPHFKEASAIHLRIWYHTADKHIYC